VISLTLHQAHAAVRSNNAGGHLVACSNAPGDRLEGPGNGDLRRQGSDADGAQRPGEDDYSFYDSAARPEHDVYRGLLNGWMEGMSEEGQRELLPRLRRNESLEYQTALAELTTHAALKNGGYAVEVPNATKPTGSRIFWRATRTGHR
jgi:hypothetical protein